MNDITTCVFCKRDDKMCIPPLCIYKDREKVITCILCYGMTQTAGEFCVSPCLCYNKDSCFSPLGFSINGRVLITPLVCSYCETDREDTKICILPCLTFIQTVEIETSAYNRLISPIGCFNHIPQEPELNEAPEKQYMEDQCVCCKDTAPQIGFTECGHVCVCDSCLKKITKCPMCNGPVNKLFAV